MPSISRTATPISVTIDTTDSTPTNCNAPSTALVTANGFQVKTTSTVAANACNVGGNATINF